MSAPCPKKKKAPSPPTCSLSSSWTALEKEKQRLSLQQQKLDLDRQLLKAEKKKIRRSAQVNASTQNHDRKKYNVDMQDLKTQREQQVEYFQEEMKTLEENHKMALLEWKLKFSKQASGLAEAENEIENSKKQKDEMFALAASKEKIEKELIDARTKINSLEKELERAANEGPSEKVEKELSGARLKIHDLEKELERIAMASSDDKVEKELSNARTKISDLEEELDLVEKEKRSHSEISMREKQELEQQIENIKEQLREKETVWGKEHDSLKEEHDRLKQEANDFKTKASLVDDLQEALTKIRHENKNYEGQVKDLEDQCAKLQEQQHREGIVETVVMDGANAIVEESSRANYEALEEEVYDLKMKLNKRQVEHERQMKELEDELRNKFKAAPLKSSPPSVRGESEREMNSEVQDSMSNVATVKTAREQQKERQIAIDRQKAESKVLALEAKINTNAKEKAEMEELLQVSKSETLQLALQYKEKTMLEQKELSRLKNEMDKLQEKQNQYAKQQEKDKQEWNSLFDRLTEKQSQIFDNDLPALGSKVSQFDIQISELIEQQKVFEESEKQVSKTSNLKPPPPDSNAEPLENRRSSHRRPPLTKMDSRKNRHVTEFDFKSEKQCGKYTGFLNMQNLPQGHGILRVDTGDVYEGEWESGKRHGKGVYTWYDGDLYTGPWCEGKRHGHGVFVFSDGRLYDGEYNMGQREGQGMFVWPYGAKYEGSYYQDKRNGSGVYVYADGRIYRGEYKDDRPHGYGVESSKDGTTIYDGNWAFGEFVGDGQSLMDGHSIAGGSIISYRR